MLTPVYIICPQGHRKTVAPHSIQRGGGWCCENSHTAPTTLYLLTGMFSTAWWAKVGVTSAKQRLHTLYWDRWIPYRSWEGLLPTTCLRVEKHIKNRKSELKWSILSKESLKGSGYTESFPLRYIDTVEGWIEYLL